MRPSDALLNDPKALVIRPKLAVMVGLTEAVLLNQVHWAQAVLEGRVVELDGRRWLRANLDWWKSELPFVSEATLKRAFAHLRDRGLLHTSRGKESNVYAIDYDALDALISTAHIDPSSGSNRAVPPDHIDPSPCMKKELQEEEDKQRGTETVPEGAEPGTLFGPPPPASPPPSSPQSATQPDATMKAAERIWERWLHHFGDHMRVKALTDRRLAALKKALKACGFEDDEEVAVLVCTDAVDGFKSWVDDTRAQRIDIGMVFETRPGGPNLTDNIESWARRAPEKSGGSGNLHRHPSAIRARVRRHRVQVTEMYGQPDLSGVRERGEQALAWLRDQAHEEPIIEGDPPKVTGWRELKA